MLEQLHEVARSKIEEFKNAKLETARQSYFSIFSCHFAETDLSVEKQRIIAQLKRAILQFFYRHVSHPVIAVPRLKRLVPFELIFCNDSSRIPLPSPFFSVHVVDDRRHDSGEVIKILSISSAVSYNFNLTNCHS